MTHRPIKFVTFVFFIVLVSCSKEKQLLSRDYINWVESYQNGLHVRKISEEFVFDLQYEPTPYNWLKNQVESEPTILPDFDSDGVSNIQYYILTIKPSDNQSDLIAYSAKDESQKQQRLYYFSYLFEHDIHIEENSKNLPCVLFHFEKTIDFKLDRTFILGFENAFKTSEAATLVISSPQFGSLPIKIKVTKSDIPRLKI